MSSRISDEKLTSAWNVGLKSKDGTTALERIAEAQKNHSDLEWVDLLAVYLTHKSLTLKGLYKLLKENNAKTH